MEERLLRTSATVTVIITTIACCLIVFFQLNKNMLLELETRYGLSRESEHTIHEEVVSYDTASTNFTQINVIQAKENDILRVPIAMSQGDTPILTYDYAKQYNCLFLPGVATDKIQNIEADIDIVSGKHVWARNIVKDGQSGLQIQIPLEGYYESKMTIESDSIILNFEKILPIEGTTVVLDAGHGGKDYGLSCGDTLEKNLTLEIMERVSSKLQESGIRVYMTRMEDVEASDRQRIAFANEIRADMVVSLHYNFYEEADQNAIEGITMVYNDTFFIPQFGSVELSQIIRDELLGKISGNMNGLRSASKKDDFIRYACIPVTQIIIGCVKNEGTRELVENENYQELVSEGIYKGILKAQEKLNDTTN